MCIEDLCSQNTDNDILKALENLPRSLEEIFDRRVSRIRAQKEARNAIKVLQYCGVLKCPLGILEYQEILSLSLGQKSLQRGSFPNDMNKIWADCCGLVFVDEEETTVHYVHQSVKQYLFDTKGHSVKDFDSEKIDLHLGHLCMTYLDFSDFKRQLARTQRNVNVPLNPIEIGISSISNSTNSVSTINRVALKLLSRRRQLQHVRTGELERNIEELTNSLAPTYGNSDMGEEFHFLEYAKKYWILHATSLDPHVNPGMWDLFTRCMESDDIDACKPWKSEGRDGKGTTQRPILAELIFSSHYGLLFYMTRVLHNEMTEETILEILRRCKLKDRLRYTKLIISRIPSWKGVPVRMSNVLTYGLFYAAKAGCVETVDLLIHNGVRIHTAVEEGTALQMAARAGHLEVVDRLLAAPVYTEDYVSDSLGENGKESQTTLQDAAERGFSQIVRRLLNSGADPNAPPGHNGRRALHAAVANGHFDTVVALLEGGADLTKPMNLQSDKRPLELAVESNSLPIVEKLLEVGAGQDPTAWTAAIRAAMDYGHLEIKEKLSKVSIPYKVKIKKLQIDWDEHSEDDRS